MGEGPDEDAVSELMRLSEAIKKARTEARFEAEQTVYTFSGSETIVSRFRVQYAYPYRKRECIEGPEKSRFVMLEDGKYQWSYFPARKLVVKEPLRDEDSPFPLCPPEDLHFLMKNYQFQVVGPVPSEGMLCRIVSFIPRLGDRPRREWWLEERWNVPVRVNVSSSDGRPAYMKQLREIRWNAELGPDTFRLKVPKDTRMYEIQEQENLTIEEARRLVNRPVVLPPAIPVGYRPHDIVLRSEGSRLCLQIIYTDGLSSFSFFRSWPNPGMEAARIASKITPDEDLSVPSSSQHGLMNVVTLPGPDGRAIIVGDVNQDSLLEMAESLRAALRESVDKALSEALQENPSPPPPTP
jgi:outer membrane lipoprotein-sorting protein